MAGVLGPIHHLGCQEELLYVARIRLAEWMTDLPREVEEYCELGDDRWFDSLRVLVAFNRAWEAWRIGTLDGGQFGPDPVPIHHTRWQRRVGTIALQAEWHAWCEVELRRALGQFGSAFAAEVRAYPEWEDDCSSGLIVFGDFRWRAAFIEHADLLLLGPWPAPPSWGVHSPVYRTW